MLTLFLTFLAQKWMLAALWVTLLYMILFYENRQSGKAVSPQELSQMVNKQDGIVLDVRDQSEFRQGHITGAINMPLRDLEKRLDELDAHKDKPIIIVCKVGQSAGSASKQLKAKGFTGVFKLGGGISEWTASNLPLVK